jgi:hypothetical protein
MKRTSTVAFSVATLALLAGLAACDSKPANQASNAAGNAASAAGKAVGDVAGKAGEVAGAAGQKAGEMADAAKQAFEKAKAEGTKWLTDTVEKQWPEAKKSLETLAGKVGSIKDVKVAEQAKGLVSELQGKVPQMESLVGKLKTAGEGDFSKLLTEAKSMWDTFSSKLGELKKLIPA